jgi:hypothetical protein
MTTQPLRTSSDAVPHDPSLNADDLRPDAARGDGAMGDGAEVVIQHVRAAPRVMKRGGIPVPTPTVDPMKVVREEAPADVAPARATLDGAACTACAWVEATRIEVRTSPREMDEIVGARSWRGRALFEELPEALREGGLWHYEGPVTVGGEVRHVRAPVIVHTLRSLAIDGAYIVAFSGAGNLPHRRGADA